MQLALNIEHFAKPVVAERQFIKPLLKFLYFLHDRFKKSLHQDIDNLILAVEGFYPHSKDLSSSQAQLLLKSTKSVIIKLNKMDEEMHELNYLKDSLLKEKFKYMLKTLYKMESILHKEVYKNTPIEKTDEAILKGISEMNRRNMSKLLSV